MAAQFTATNGCRARRLARWIAAAASSFPVPDSPVSSTRASVGPTWPISTRIRPIAVPWPTSSSRRLSASRRATFWVRVRCSSRAERSVTRTASGLSGFSRNWKAPSWVARTASASWALPLIMMTGASIARSRSEASVAMPSGPGGISRSRNIASGSARSASSTAAGPLAASVTSKPSARSSAPSIRRMLASSSTRRIRGGMGQRYVRPERAGSPRRWPRLPAFRSPGSCLRGFRSSGGPGPGRARCLRSCW